MTEGAAERGAGGEPRARPRRSRRRSQRGSGGGGGAKGPLYAAVDLGTNNCRLLIAARTHDGFVVRDAFSRIVRLGQGVGGAGALSEDAMARTVEALGVCADKIKRRRVERVRCIATHACRDAANGPAFIDEVKERTGITLEIITPREEARLAVIGCMALIDRDVDAALVVDIGGGSTELSWIDVAELRAREARGLKMRPPIVDWMSLPWGVVSLSERFPETGTPQAWYATMKAHVAERLEEGAGAARLRAAFDAGRAHIIGTSGTITSLAGVHLGLPRYERSKVDGLWLATADAEAASARLRAMTRDERAAQPCIGGDRSDLVLAGCAILEAIMEAWPTARLRVADRGLREGVLLSLMHPPKRRRRGGRRVRRAADGAADGAEGAGGTNGDGA